MRHGCLVIRNLRVERELSKIILSGWATETFFKKAPIVVWQIVSQVVTDGSVVHLDVQVEFFSFLKQNISCH